MDFKFKPMEVIANELECRGLNYRVVDMDYGQDTIFVYESVRGATHVVIGICSRGDDEATVRVVDFVGKVPKNKRRRVMEACNMLATDRKFVSAYIDRDDCVTISHDFPTSTSLDDYGVLVYELLGRLSVMLDEYYPVFMKALYGSGRLVSPDETKRSSSGGSSVRIISGIDDEIEERRFFDGPAGSFVDIDDSFIAEDDEEDDSPDEA